VGDLHCEKSAKMLSLKKHLFNPLSCTDLDIFLRYKKDFPLPKCFNKVKRIQRRCRCFKDLEVFYNQANPLMFVCRMTDVLKDFERQFQKHDNLSLLQGDDHSGRASNENIRNLIKYHTTTLEYFRDFLNGQYNKLMQLESFKGSKIKKFLRTIDFIKMQVGKCLVQLRQTPQHPDSKSLKIYQDLTLFSHLHTLNVFKHFILSCKF